MAELLAHVRGLKWTLGGLAFDVVRRGVFRAEGQEFTVPRELTTTAFRSRFWFDLYEREERTLIEHLPADATVLELGGCLGVVSCITNARLTDRTKHVVAEANPQLIGWIERNRDRNGAGFAVEHAMVSRRSDGEFHLHDLIVGGSATRPTGRTVTVPVKSVEDVERDHDLRFDALVMDIEGGELEVLRENEELLGRLRFALVELHDFIIGDDAVRECEQRLRDAGLTRVASDGQSSAWLRT